MQRDGMHLQRMQRMTLAQTRSRAATRSSPSSSSTPQAPRVPAVISLAKGGQKRIDRQLAVRPCNGYAGAAELGEDLQLHSAEREEHW